MMESMMIKDIRNGMKNLNLTVIVLEVGLPKQIKEGGEVRTVKVADASGCINLALWDELGTLLGPGDIIRLTKANANLFRNSLTLYTSKAGELDKLGEFCMVFNEQLNMSEPGLEGCSGGGGAGAAANNGGPAGGGIGGSGPYLPLSRPPLRPPLAPGASSNIPDPFSAGVGHKSSAPSGPNSKLNMKVSGRGAGHSVRGSNAIRSDRR